MGTWISKEIWQVKFHLITDDILIEEVPSRKFADDIKAALEQLPSKDNGFIFIKDGKVLIKYDHIVWVEFLEVTKPHRKDD